MDQLASHGLFDVTVEAEGDTWIDDHHTNEDIALALGSALAQARGHPALGGRAGGRAARPALAPGSTRGALARLQRERSCSAGSGGRKRHAGACTARGPLCKRCAHRPQRQPSRHSLQALGDRKGIHRFGDFTGGPPALAVSHCS